MNVVTTGDWQNASDEIIATTGKINEMKIPINLLLCYFEVESVY
jgi:hypothetical protein